MEAIKPGSCEALTGVEYASSAAAREAPSGRGPKKSAELDDKEYVYVGGKDIKAQGKLEGR
ncbi:hypothetical protein Tdes44962_MAKER03311 [Teratosphaeria destructans]|uniref:Uncharacterized protein n=1 Tax=Teratosphaeria destructans TaxID=418781 RepID=A0A9W7SR32_9PEZI|nr:hypothetical protein Tdes44962_MAKER03311 [Teratosphaeria destructans]